MKRIEALIQSDKQKQVIDAITKVVGGVTVTQSLGSGSGERPRIGGPKGTKFNSMQLIL
jgi:nitrogen regulatory protein PII